MSLRADAVAVLTRWSAPDDDQETLRRGYLRHLAEHPDGVWRGCHPDHLTGSALIVGRDGRVLLHRHRKAGLWLPMGGHCEPRDATLAAVAAREATEESGMTGLLLDPDPVQLSRHRVPFCGPVQPAHHLDVQFLAVAPTGSTPRPAPEETSEIGWFDPGDLPEPTDDDVRGLVAAAARRLGSRAAGRP